MTQTSIQCPYCGAIISLATVKKASSHKFTIEIYEYERSSSRQFLSNEIDCSFCLKKYEYIVMKDFSWIRNRLKWSKTALTTFKTLFLGKDLDVFYTSITGIARPKKRLRRLRGDSLHICFRIDDITAYLDCSRKKDKLRGVDIYKV